MKALAATAAARFGTLDCAFDIAGGARPGYIVDLAEAESAFTIDLCLKGVFLSMKHAGPAEDAAGQGRAIVSAAP